MAVGRVDQPQAGQGVLDLSPLGLEPQEPGGDPVGLGVAVGCEVVYDGRPRRELGGRPGPGAAAERGGEGVGRLQDAAGGAAVLREVEVESKSPASTKLVACCARVRMTSYSARCVSYISSTWTSSKRCSRRVLTSGLEAKAARVTQMRSAKSRAWCAARAAW